MPGLAEPLEEADRELCDGGKQEANFGLNRAAVYLYWTIIKT